MSTAAAVCVVHAVVVGFVAVPARSRPSALDPRRKERIIVFFKCLHTTTKICLPFLSDASSVSTYIDTGE